MPFSQPHCPPATSSPPRPAARTAGTRSWPVQTGSWVLRSCTRTDTRRGRRPCSTRRCSATSATRSVPTSCPSSSPKAGRADRRRPAQTGADRYGKDQHVEAETVSWLEDRVAGVLAGAAVGDALGGATEGWTPEQIEERHGGRVTGIVGPFLPDWRTARPIAPYHKGDGHVTDDTLMTHALVEVYAAR